MSTDAHPAPDPDEWRKVARIAIKSMVRRGSSRQLSREVYQDLTGMAFVTIAKLHDAGTFQGLDTALQVAMVRNGIIDQLRIELGRSNPKAHVGASSIDSSEIRAAGADPVNWHEAIADPDGELELEQRLEADEARQLLDRMWPGMSPRLRFVAQARAGGMSLREIGEALGVTESRVSQLLTQLEQRARKFGPKAA